MRTQTIIWLIGFVCLTTVVQAKNLETILEITVGQLVAEDLENKFAVSDSPEFNSAVQNLAAKLVPYAKREGIDYQFKVLNSDEINAYAVMGGLVYVNRGFLKALGFASSEFDPLDFLRQIFGGGGRLLEPITPAEDELAFILGHEITHIKERHGVKQALLGLGLSMLFGKSDPQKTAGAAKIIAGQLLVSGRSRKDEDEADAGGVKLMTQAGYDPLKALAVMRRLETLDSNQKKLGVNGMLKRLFATHPPTKDRAQALKDYFIKSTTGFTFKADIARAAATRECLGPHYTPDDSKWVQDFTQKTGRKVEHLNQANASYGKLIGQCTWFVCAVREDDLLSVVRGKGDAYRWFKICQDAGYACGQEPKIGAIAVWVKAFGGYGHVALVTGVRNDGSFEVWDCNLHEDCKVGNHLFYSQRDLQGFVYWSGGQTGPPPVKLPEVGPVKPRNKILIEKGPRHLGDNEAKSKTIWLKKFGLTVQDLTRRTKARILISVKGTPRKDPVIWVNRHKIGFALTQTDKWEKFEFPVELSILQEGNNLIDIETVIANLWQTFDECEFANLYLILE